MKIRTHPPVWIAALAILIPVAAAREPEVIKPFDQPSRVTEVIAANYAFTPSLIHIKAGKNIQLRVTSTDQTYGIRINPFPDAASKSTAPGLEFVYGEDCWKLKKGEAVKIELVAHTLGTYTFTCCKGCGSGHRQMKGQLVVEPSRSGFSIRQQ